MLQILFQQYPGFREVRMIEAKPGIAFVEFGDDVQSSIAMQALQGFKITPQNPMAISYAKKWWMILSFIMVGGMKMMDSDWAEKMVLKVSF